MANGQPPQGPEQPQGPAQLASEEDLLANPDEGVQAVLTGQLEGFDPQLLFDEDERPSETTGVREDQILQGQQPDEDPFDLDDTQLEMLARDTIGVLELYDDAMNLRWQREDEIEAAYALAAEPLHGGTTADAEHIPSEFLMSQVDQAVARIEENLLGARPLIKVDPVMREGEEEAVLFTKKFAQSTERFMNSFMMHDSKLEKKLPLIAHRCVKVGTTVIHPWWQGRRRTQRYWGNDGEVLTKQKHTGSIEIDLPPNRHIICWPPNKVDWQECSYVGHRFFLTEAEFRTFGRNQLELNEEKIEEVLGRSPDEDYAGGAKIANEQGIRESEELDQKIGKVKLTQLYFYMTLPDQDEPRSGYMILHEETQQILLLDKNRFWNELFPYFPVRYKVMDEASWGMGMGDELISIHSQDAALRNLQMDNLMSGAFNLIQVTAGSMADVLIDRPLPGQMVPVDKPGEDIVATPMGGKADGIDDTIQQNRFFGREATGLAPVLGGQGDPTMKSGAGTGSTLALIEQAGKKFGAVDRKMRMDLSDFFSFCLDMVTQYAQDGLYYKYVSDEDAHRIELYKYEPIRGIVDDNFRVFASAPNAATSKEGRHQSLMVWWQFMNQHNQLMMEMAGSIFAEQNPAGYQEWMEKTVRFMDWVVHQIAHTQEIPGMASLMPELPDETPVQEKMNALMAQLQEAQQQLEQMMMEKQQQEQMAMQGGMGGGMPPGGAPPGGGMPPGGGPQGMVG